MCESLRHMTSSKTEWTSSKQNGPGMQSTRKFDMAKSVITEDVCMKFYDETQPLYLETDPSGIGLGVSLLQTIIGTSYPRDKAAENSILRPIAFVNKSLSSAEGRYSNIERDALGILHRLQKFHCYCL